MAGLAAAKAKAKAKASPHATHATATSSGEGGDLEASDCWGRKRWQDTRQSFRGIGPDRAGNFEGNLVDSNVV